MKIRIGRVEIAFAVLLAAYAASTFFPGVFLLKFLLRWTTIFLACWAGVRISREAVQQALWRLRNRLLVAYLLIAVVPIVLIVGLLGLGTYLLSGQIAIYLITSEMDRSQFLLRGTAERLSSAPRPEMELRARGSLPLLAQRFPGLRIAIDGDSKWNWPANSSFAAAPAQQDVSGLVMKDGLVYGWAHSVKAARRVTLLYPVTRELLGELAPNLGETALLRLDAASNPLAHDGVDNSRSDPSLNRLTPPVNRFDFEVDHGERIQVPLWENPERAVPLVLAVRTRPSAVLRAIFPQRLDFGKETIPMLMFLFGVLFLVAELVALYIGISITRSITGAVHDLYEGTAKITTGAFGVQIPVRGKDQLAELGHSFNDMSANLERLIHVEREQVRLNAELQIAREVQSQLYPKSLPELRSLRLTAACNPARMVSGDYYDFQLLGGERVALAVGDVAGKGISAALLMATVQSAFRTKLGEATQNGASELSPSALVAPLNRHLHAYTTPEKFATFLFGVLDGASGTFTYTNAGHLPPVVLHEGRPSRLDVNGMVIGAFAFAAYDESRVTLEPGDLMVLFTDGITEPENEYGEQFGEERLIDLIARNAEREDKQIFEDVMDAVRHWSGEGELQDDMTLLLVRRV